MADTEHEEAILRAQHDEESSHRFERKKQQRMKEELPMQTIISRALRELEDDFGMHRK